MRSHTTLLTLSALLTLTSCGGGSDTKPPDTSFGSTALDGRSNAAPSEFAVSCTESSCTFECSLDGSPYEPCTAAPSFTGLAAGSHTLSVRAVDGAGNTDETPATHTWSVRFGWREVAVGAYGACGIAVHGGLFCWGSEYSGELGDGDPEESSVARPQLADGTEGWEGLVASWNAFCARRDGQTYCWGANWDGEFGDPAVQFSTSPMVVAHSFATYELGDYHGCGLAADGALSCWGDNGDGQLGVGDTSERPTPAVVGTNRWRSVSAGAYHTCGIDSVGALFCWGENDSGEVGQDPPSAVVAEPTQVGTDTDWQSVSAGGSFTCGIRTGGTLWCWGDNGAGQLGDGTTTDHTAPVQVPGTWRAVFASASSVCATDAAGLASCWGDNGTGQLGAPTLASDRSSMPVRLAHAGVVDRIDGADDLRCALSAGEILCWGNNLNSDGGLGRGVRGVEPQVVDVDGGWAEVRVAERGGCGRRTNGTLACWGLGFHVPGTIPLAYSPVDVPAPAAWTAFDVTALGNLAGGHACGIASGRLYCWGSGAAGQLGDGTAELRTAPVEVVVSGVTWASVSTGNYSTCAVTTAGGLYCWGGGTNTGPFGGVNYGQVGDGSSVQRNSPVAITTPAADGWTSVSVRGQRVTARRDDGSAWAWGVNTNGTGNPTPTVLRANGDVEQAVTTASGTSCVRTTAGAALCTSYVYQPSWDRALEALDAATDHTELMAYEGGICSMRSGALHCYWNNGTTWSDNFPSLDPNDQIAAPTGAWSQLSLSYWLRCGVRPDGTRACAGRRFTGSFGDGVDERLPVAVLVP